MRISFGQTTSRRLADRKTAKFQKNITRRGSVPETTVKKGNDYPVGPLVLGFFIFVVIGSCMCLCLLTLKMFSYYIVLCWWCATLECTLACLPRIYAYGSSRNLAYNLHGHDYETRVCSSNSMLRILIRNCPCNSWFDTCNAWALPRSYSLLQLLFFISVLGYHCTLVNLVLPNGFRSRIWTYLLSQW